MLETKKIGNRIAEARKRFGLSQAELAQRLFISSQAVGKWERGESMPDITTFGRMAEFLGVDLNYFLEKDQPIVFESQASDPNPNLIKNKPESTHKQKKEPSWDMSELNLFDADFSGLKNLSDKFSSSNILRCTFLKSELAGLLFKGNNIDHCDFSGSDIGSSHFQNTNLANNRFNDCLFNQAEFSGSYVFGSDFTGANFTGARFRSGGIEKSITENAIWVGTSFSNTYLGEMLFSGTLKDCFFEACGFKNVRFENAVLINTFFKNNRKMQKVKFANCKADRITYAFLKSNLANLDGIAIIDE